MYLLKSKYIEILYFILLKLVMFTNSIAFMLHWFIVLFLQHLDALSVFYLSECCSKFRLSSTLLEIYFCITNSLCPRMGECFLKNYIFNYRSVYLFCNTDIPWVCSHFLPSGSVFADSQIPRISGETIDQPD